MTGAVTKPCGARTTACADSNVRTDNTVSTDCEKLLIAFTDSVFGDSGKSISDPKAYTARRVFALRLNREYRHFLGEGLSHRRAAAAAIGRAENLLSGYPFNKIPSSVCKREAAASCNPREASGDIARCTSPQTANADMDHEANIIPSIGSNVEPVFDKINPINTIMQETKSISEKSEVENKMKNSLKVYVDSLFQGAPQSEPVRELHDEILSNLEERYDDCIAGGMTPQRAYTAVVGTMGDIGKLIRQVSEENRHPGGLFERSSPTGKGIFKKYSYIFTDKNLKIIKRSAIAVMWILLVAFYFMISFYTDQWDFTWVVFLVGAGLNVAINMAGDIACFSRRGDDSESRIKILKSIRGSMSAILWLATTFFYFMICESHNYMVERAWIIFILAAAVQVVMNAVIKIQINRYKD